MVSALDSGSSGSGSGLPGTVCFVLGQDTRENHQDNKVGHFSTRLVRSTPDRVVRVRACRGQCVVFLGKTLYSHGAFLHPGV